MSERRLILVRHAHRDKKQGRDVDNGLSKKGWKQEARFRKHWKKRLKGRSVTFVSSPKLRCVETVAPLAAALDCDVGVMNLLDEQRNEESQLTFDGRIMKFIVWMKTQKVEYVVASSHGDWIPDCLALLGVGREEISKGDWRKIDLPPKSE